MPDDESRVQIGRLEERNKDLERRVSKLEENLQKGVWVVIGLTLKALFDLLKNGGAL